MSSTFFAEQASMTRAKFWLSIDTHLRALGEDSATSDEVDDLYRDGVPVPQAFRTVLARRVGR